MEKATHRSENGASHDLKPSLKYLILSKGLICYQSNDAPVNRVNDVQHDSDLKDTFEEEPLPKKGKYGLPCGQSSYYFPFRLCDDL